MILSGFFKAAVFKLSRPPRGLAGMTIGGEEARFFAGNYEQLRYIRRFSDAKGVNEARILELLMDVLKPRDAVYDIGANIGIHTVFMAKRVGPSGRVISFEPDMAIADILEDHVRLNDLKNVRVLRMALGNRDYQGDLFVNKKIGRGSTSLVRTEGKTLSGKACVVGGDRIVAEEGLPVPRAVKIDVEGYEIEVLKGLRETLRDPRCAYLCCEIHPTLLPNGRTERDVIRLIEGSNFSPMGVYRGQEVHAMFRKVEP
jgi:FkbM family methyltransferase